MQGRRSRSWSAIGPDGRGRPETCRPGVPPGGELGQHAVAEGYAGRAEQLIRQSPGTERADAPLTAREREVLALVVRHGFEVTEQVRLPNGPPLTLMWREPQG
ncbi:MAG TPA: hypothetical protein VFZ63_16625 [Jiangellaceae bacterium]